MQGYGTYPFPKGCWSDDTSMSLCALDTFGEGKLNFDKVMINFARWYYQDLFTPTGEKIEIAFSLIFCLGIIILMLIIGFGDYLGIEPLVDFKQVFDFENKTDEQILAFFLNDFSKYIMGFIIVVMVSVIISNILRNNSFVDMAKWLERNDVDCYNIIKNGQGNRVSNLYFSNGFLIKERPESKGIFNMQVGVLVINAVLLVLALPKFFASFIAQTYEAFEVYGVEVGEWLKTAFTSPDAITLYVVLIVVIVLNSLVKKKLRSKQKEVLNSMANEK